MKRIHNPSNPLKLSTRTYYRDEDHAKDEGVHGVSKYRVRFVSDTFSSADLDFDITPGLYYFGYRETAAKKAEELSRKSPNGCRCVLEVWTGHMYEETYVYR